MDNIGFIPSLMQYDPKNIYFEAINGQLIITAQGGISLIRYNIKDQVRIITHQTVVDILKSFGLYEKLKEIADKWDYPLVALYGRTDIAVTFYAINIYPENIKAGIEDKPFSKSLTGKFVANVQTSEDQIEQILIVIFELAPNIEPCITLSETVKNALFNSLISLNGEFRKLYNSIKK